jgi:hypothetical protein
MSAGAEAVRASMLDFSRSGDWASHLFPCERASGSQTVFQQHFYFIYINPLLFLTQQKRTKYVHCYA